MAKKRKSCSRRERARAHDRGLAAFAAFNRSCGLGSYNPGRCDMPELVKKIRAAKRLPLAASLKPLRRHLFRLAINSAKTGYCQRAGQEVAKAVKLAKKHPS